MLFEDKRSEFNNSFGELKSQMQTEILELKKSCTENKLKFEQEKVAENLKNSIKIKMLEADQKALVKTNGFMIQQMLELEIQ